jgi:hypothetical protein
MYSCSSFGSFLSQTRVGAFISSSMSIQSSNRPTNRFRPWSREEQGTAALRPYLTRSIVHPRSTETRYITKSFSPKSRNLVIVPVVKPPLPETLRSFRHTRHNHVVSSSLDCLHDGECKTPISIKLPPDVFLTVRVLSKEVWRIDR